MRGRSTGAGGVCFGFGFFVEVGGAEGEGGAVFGVDGGEGGGALEGGLTFEEAGSAGVACC